MKIKKLKKNNLQIFFKYFKKNYKKKHIFLKSKKIFDWQYLDGENYNFYILVIKNKIKAIQGYIPTSLYDKKLKNDSVFLSLWSSAGLTTGSKLFFYFSKKIKHKIIIGLGSSYQSLMFQKLLNFKCGYMNHYFLTSNKISKKLISPSNFSNFKKQKFINNFKELNNEREILKINKNIFAHQTPKKTQKYLINRYLNHPFYKYNIYAIKNNLKISAIFVSRVSKYQNKSAVRIVDFVGPSLRFPNGKYLFEYLLKINSSEFIDIYCYGIPKRYLDKSNLEDIKKYKNQKLIIPNYFEPFTKKNIDLAYAFKIKRKVNNDVRFFKGDSDLDRPSKI